MRLKSYGRDLRLDLLKRGGGAATPSFIFLYSICQYRAKYSKESNGKS